MGIPTDGYATVHHVGRWIRLIKYKWHGVVNVHAIGVGLGNWIEELECLTNSKDSIFSLSNLIALESLVNTIVEGLTKSGNNYRCVKPACPYILI